MSETHTKEEIKEVSPEGEPAHPEAGPKKITGYMVLAVVTLIVAAIVLAIMGQTVIAIGLGVAAVLMMILNPVFWASVMRAKERND